MMILNIPLHNCCGKNLGCKLAVELSLHVGPLEKGQVKNEALRELRVELSKKHKARELDGFGLYL